MAVPARRDGSSREEGGDEEQDVANTCADGGTKGTDRVSPTITLLGTVHLTQNQLVPYMS